MYFITTAALISAFATGIRASDAVDPGEFIGTFDTFISKVNCDRGGHGITVNGSTSDKCLDLPNGTMEIKSYLPKGYAIWIMTDDCESHMGFDHNQGECVWTGNYKKYKVERHD